MNEEIKSLALITGASAGLGAAFARQLAGRGYNLILVARRKEKLADLAAEIKKDHQIDVEILQADLATIAGIQKVEQRIQAINRLDILINNAGFGLAGEFARQSVDQNQDMLQVHCVAPMRMVHAALPGMIARQSGTIINVASISAFIPMTGNVQYSASKSYLVTFSRALQLENQRNGIKLQVLCPGFFHSEFHDVMRANKKTIPGWLFMQADKVARRSLGALKHRSVVYIPGFIYQLAVLLVSIPWLGDELLAVSTRLIARRRGEFIRAGG
jgi:short-subunit dehydrogenase